MDTRLEDLMQMPFSMEAEQAVLGSILIDPACMNRAQMIISWQDFYLPQHQVIFAAMEERAARNLKIDPLIILDMIKREEAYDDAGGRKYLYQIARAVPSTANIESYAQIMKEKATARAGITKAQEIILGLSGEAEATSEIAEKAGELLQILSGVKQQKAFRLSQLLAEFSERMNEPIDYISTGFARLDKHIMLERGDYMIIGGRPSSGKTTFTIQMMLEMTKRHRVVYFSLETSKEKITDRSVANRSGVGLRNIKRHELNFDDRTAIAESMDEYKGYECYVVPAAGWTVERVRAMAQLLRAEIIFVDYLGLIGHGGKDLYQKVTGISIALHTLAQSTGITVVALSQLNREGKNGPELESLRDSGQIEQDADQVILIAQPNIPYTNDPAPDKRSVRIAKNKEGESGTEIQFHFDGARQLFTAIDGTR